MIGNALDLQTLIWALMAILVAGGAVAWARRRAQDSNARGPGVLLSLVIWAGLIGLVVLIIQGAAFWSALMSLFS